MAKYKVKKINKGVEKGKWGVYRNGELAMTFEHEWQARQDASRRTDNEWKP